MEPTKRPRSRLTTMPDDILRLILSMIGAASSTDYANTRLASKSLNFSLDDPVIAKNLSLAPLVKNPLLANGYKKLMETLLEAKNVDAHYIKGILEYFHFDNHYLGIHHLRLASKGGHKEATYLYGLLLMALGLIEKGKKALNNLTNEEGLAIVERCWGRIQTSLSQLNVKMEKEYVESYERLQPEINCHPPEIDTVCVKCFHSYIMSEFFEMVIGLNPPPETKNECNR